MYKVNENTKIGREIKNQIEQKLYKDCFYDHDVSFLTHPNEEKSEYNIHIYPENRLQHLKENLNEYPGWFKEKDIHIPGCVISCILAEYEYSGELVFKKLNNKISVEFGKKAAGSRAEDKYKEYPENSHTQLDELKYLIRDDNLNLNHTYNPEIEDSNFIMNGYEFTRDTVKEIARHAILSAIIMIEDVEK